ncbi:hypothetical protein HZS38_09020 [Xenorhabdus nematophila]|uniref:hypothetical protein n=1 Tax=Xenorhabdus nematophila TaxID=628 RepID=UPI0003154A1B|nr:hypothetical protein [Xenorhabdus nematophila]CEE94241.1 conserved exported hypothetical protein [Xenorhabdus nematophila str. Anatoliense]CEF32651.1 conserved exported hypothetical protein [Xenorhabdus nematophila str. Websteri]AYA40536.1 hypothetical protein D3790_08895 [Xenorhabdus nematophila]MBA0019272.1 hypothetical protein [Xenorhabdus nematophila]MCB4426445.1 hypothetical protein [Xenorhabdus nematophila]
MAKLRTNALVSTGAAAFILLREAAQRINDTRDREDTFVLYCAWLNSFCQTRIRNLMIQVIDGYDSRDSETNFLHSYRKIDELSFGFVRFRLSIFIQNLYRTHQLAYNDAEKKMLSICSFIRIKEKIILLTEESRNNVVKLVSRYHEQGFKVLILVALELSPDEVKHFLSVTDEKEMVLQGLLTFLELPKESAAIAIVTLGKMKFRLR